MKSQFLSFIIISLSTILPLSALSEPLSLAVSIPARNGEHILDSAHNPRFYVILSNTTNYPQRVWAPWSQASYRALSFEFKEKDGKTWKATPKEWEGVSHKLPEICELQPGECIVFEIDYSNKNAWENFPTPIANDSQISIQAVFENAPETTHDKHQVWSGKIVSRSLTVTIRPR